MMMEQKEHAILIYLTMENTVLVIMNMVRTMFGVIKKKVRVMIENFQMNSKK